MTHDKDHETYAEYIQRVTRHRRARIVNMEDLLENMINATGHGLTTTPKVTLIPRYNKSIQILLQAMIAQQELY